MVIYPELWLPLLHREKYMVNVERKIVYHSGKHTYHSKEMFYSRLL